MFRGKTVIQWLGYFFEPETPETICAYKPFGVLKVFMWVGVSLLMAMGVSSLA